MPVWLVLQLLIMPHMTFFFDPSAYANALQMPWQHLLVDEYLISSSPLIYMSYFRSLACWRSSSSSVSHLDFWTNEPAMIILLVSFASNYFSWTETVMLLDFANWYLLSYYFLFIIVTHWFLVHIVWFCNSPSYLPLLAN